MTPLIQPSRVLPGGIIALPPDRFTRDPWIELGWPGMDPAAPCIDIIVLDSSGSVAAPRGNDPVGNRFAEAGRAIKVVSAWSHSARSKIAVLHFDHPQGASGVHALNTKHLMRKLAPSLRVPRGGAGTSNLGPPLLEAERLAGARPDHQTRLTVLSDFELTDRDPARVLSRLLVFPGHVHAVVLGGQVPPDLHGASNVTVTPLAPSDPPGAFAAAIHRSLTATRRGTRHSVLRGPNGKEPV